MGDSTLRKKLNKDDDMTVCLPGTIYVTDLPSNGRTGVRNIELVGGW